MRFVPTAKPSNFDDITKGLNFSFHDKAFKLAHTLSSWQFICAFPWF
jgi:hypothetical protein